MAYPDDGKPIRVQCLEALRTALEGIRRSSGDYTDIAQVLILESEKLVSGVQMPAAVIVDDGIDERIDENVCQVTQLMPIAVYLGIRTVGGAPWVTEIGWFVADVVKAIDADPQLSATALYTDVVGMSVFESPVDNVASAVVKLNVVYRHVIGDPASITA